MRAQSIPQFAIVQADSAAAFEEQLNARIREVSDKNPVVKFDVIRRIPYAGRLLPL